MALAHLGKLLVQILYPVLQLLEHGDTLLHLLQFLGQHISQARPRRSAAAIVDATQKVPDLPEGQIE
jgi:hypothetical protein